MVMIDAAKDRLEHELAETSVRLGKLEKFVDSLATQRLSGKAWLLLQAQRDAMRLYVYIMQERLEGWEGL